MASTSLIVARYTNSPSCAHNAATSPADSGSPSACPSVRSEVLQDCLGITAIKQMWLGYQRTCVKRARERYPEESASMGDADVWDLLCG